MFTSLISRHNSDLNLGQSIDTQQGRQYDLGLAVDRSASSQRAIIIGSRQLLRDTTRDCCQHNLLAPAVLSSDLTDIGNLPFHGQLACGINCRRLEGNVRRLQIGTRNLLDGNGTVLLTSQHILLLTVTERHTIVQQVNREYSPIVCIGRQRNVKRQQCAFIVKQQVILLAIYDDTIDMIIVNTTMTAGATPLSTSVANGQLMIRGTVLGQRNRQLSVRIGNQFERYGDVKLHTRDVALILQGDRQAKCLTCRIFH